MARKILLADDSVTAQNMGRKILTDAGYEVITVNNGSAALKKIAETKPDLIVLDVYMPGYSGLEVCSRLKEVKETARIPVLLTVGKLEPFKPEEAKRVKAEGYIVKPFEASELLSALSKLEDRVVPRSESSKPGRFARAIAAVEEGRTDEAAQANDSDNGWKNRIVFPSKKKKKQEEDDSDIYNPGNRDLRTTVERPTPQRESSRNESSRNESSRNDDRLDVAALAATAGLPKDVTAEELAALAAAAAQVQAAVDGRESSPAFGPERTEARSAEAPAPQASAEAVPKAEEAKAEAKNESQPVSQAAAPEVAAEIPAGATFAGQTGGETPAAVSASASPKEAKTSAPVRDFDVIAAPAAQAEGSAVIQGEAGSGNGTGRSQQDAERKGTEEKRAAEDDAAVPVTMAVAAAAGASFLATSSTHRWTAVPVAIAAEESAVSLELEMQKAYAAFAAAEANQPGFMVSPLERATPTVENSISAQAAEAPSGPVPDEDEIARTLRDVAHASAEAVDSALAKLEAVAEANAGTVPGVTQAEESSTEIVAAAMRDLEAKRELEAKESEARELEAREREAKEREARELEAREREAKEREARELEAREREAKEREARELEAREREAKEREARELEAKEREAKEREAQELEAREREAREREAREVEAREREAREQAEAAAAQAAAEAARAAELAASEQSAPQSVSSSVSEPPVAAVAEEVASPNASSAASTVEPPPTETVAAVSEVAAPGKEKEKVAGGDMAENEIAATTAAAWASWRQIRETGDGKKATGPAKANQQDDDDDDYPAPPPDTAAMAVAAGAEKAAAEAPEGSADDPAAIASIVDKVLADLRPKIAEEISKKLKKK